MKNASENNDNPIKLIWDFRGPSANKTAEHHQKHLKEYLFMEEISQSETGLQHLSEFHSISYVIVVSSILEKIKKDLKPQRGERVLN